ncbi:MAG: hypothetical protein JSR85_03185 [Proteobacteria bacterium]|nr:hypothetical protein [Pseudomonadota bacterium]
MKNLLFSLTISTFLGSYLFSTAVKAMRGSEDESPDSSGPFISDKIKYTPAGERPLDPKIRGYLQGIDGHSKNPLQAIKMLARLELYGDEEEKTSYKGAMLRSLLFSYIDPAQLKKIESYPEGEAYANLKRIEELVTDKEAYANLKVEFKNIVDKAAAEGNLPARHNQIEGLLVGFVWPFDPGRAAALNTTLAEAGDKRARKRAIKGLYEGKNGYEKNYGRAESLAEKWGMSSLFEKLKSKMKVL